MKKEEIETLAHGKVPVRQSGMPRISLGSGLDFRTAPAGLEFRARCRSPQTSQHKEQQRTAGPPHPPYGGDLQISPFHFTACPGRLQNTFAKNGCAPLISDATLMEGNRFHYSEMKTVAHRKKSPSAACRFFRAFQLTADAPRFRPEGYHQQGEDAGPQVDRDSEAGAYTSERKD